MSEPIRVIVAGAGGRLGREVVGGVLGASPEMALVGAVDPVCAGRTVSEALGADSPAVITSDLSETLSRTAADAVVVVTVPAAGMESIRTSIKAGAVPVVGTTGITQQDIEEIRQMAAQHGVGAIIAPNFSIGAVLMMRMASEAVKYFPNVEIIELHHDKKLDAPSGTAIKTAALIAASRPEGAGSKQEETVSARGGDFHGVRIHSVRLPGLVAHQEVIFGGLGQTLTIRHDSYDRKSFMPGVLLAIRKARGLADVIHGLENVI